MKLILGTILSLALLFGASGSTERALAAISPSNCAPDGLQHSGAVYRICMPALTRWNHDLVVYAHGYVAFNEAVAIPEDQLKLPGGPSIAEIVNSLGFAFATTSYSTNGLAIQQGLDDVVDLTKGFTSLYGEPRRIYLAGPSEGGIITALAIEQHPAIFDGGLSACGPVGDFPSQINYWGDVRVIFDYFFPEVLPGSAVAVPADAIEQWESLYEPRIREQLRTHPSNASQWTAVADIPLDVSNVDSSIDALIQLLWYSVFATNDGIEKLGGQPFDNSQRIYRGSKNDSLLNYGVLRHVADPGSIQEMQTRYQTSGNIVQPMVMLHTTDPLIPVWHEGIYALKVTQMQKESLVTSLVFPGRYGHCNFSAAQVLLGFILLVHNVTHTIPANAEIALTAEEQREEFEQLMEEYFTPIAPDVPGLHLYLPMIEDPGSN